ncbi:MAG: TRAP transporter substrate-binding protein [Thermodesulfobacteriota bacterium]
MKGFFKILGFLVVLGLLLPVGPAQAEKVKFTFATTNSPKDFSSQAVMRWQKAMKEASNGELDMTFIPGGALGGDKQLLQQLSANEIQLHVAGPVVVHHLVREYQCMEAEFVYKDEAHGFRVWTGPLGKEVSKKLESQYNITIVGVGSRGARNLTSNVPVREPADMKAIKIRVTNPLRQEIFKAFGALPAPLSIGELYGALRQGVFEAQENPISTIWGHKFYEVQKYINLTGHVWSYWVISANKKFVDSLSPGHRKIFMDTLNDAVAWLNKTVPAETNNLLKKMEQKGVTVIKPDVAAFQKVAAPIVKKFASEKCRPGLLDDIAKYQ